jgi:uncharacterized damage-inducible protein DinB
MSTGDQTLVDLLVEIRGAMLRIIEGVDDETATWRVPGLANHILWHAGHAYVVVEWLTMGALGREPDAPAGWFELFSWESDPANIPPEQFPTLSVVKAKLREQEQRLRLLFDMLTAEVLAQPAADQPDRSVREIIVHALQDEAAHKGEIWLLRKLHALRSA